MTANTGDRIMNRMLSSAFFMLNLISFCSLYSSLGGFTPVIDSSGRITGYKTGIGGADTVFPFYNSNILAIFHRPNDDNYVSNVVVPIVETSCENYNNKIIMPKQGVLNALFSGMTTNNGNFKLYVNGIAIKSAPGTFFNKIETITVSKGDEIYITATGGLKGVQVCSGTVVAWYDD